jgi:hypothetical protein
MAIGSEGFPFNLAKDVSYDKEACPVVEKCHYDDLFYHDLMHPNMKKSDLDDVIAAFMKVSENINDLLV